MTVSVDPLEGLWLLVNLVALIVTGLAMIEALRDLAVARTDSEAQHEARELTAFGNVRREGLRIVVQLLLLSLVIPGLLSDRPIPITPFVVVFIAIPVVLLVSTVFDARERVKLGAILLAEVRTDRSNRDEVSEHVPPPQ